MSNVIELHLLDQAAEIPFDELDPEVSTVTGRELRRIEIALTVRDDETRDALHARFGTGDPLHSSDGTAWQVGNSSSSSSRNGGAPWHITARLQEKETFSIDRIEFEDLALTPDKLEVLTDAGPRIVLSFSCDCTAEQHETFQALLTRDIEDTADEPRYFPVTAVGLLDEPISMRLGRVVYQLAEQGGGARYRVSLVSEDGDDAPDSAPLFPTLLQPAFDTVVRKTHAQEQRVDELITQLHEAGILGNEAIARIAAAAAAKPSTARRLEFWRTTRLEIFED